MTLDALKARPGLAGRIVLISPPPNQPLLARLGATFAAARSRFRDPGQPDEQFLHHVYSYLGNHLPARNHLLDVMSPDPAVIERVLADPLCWQVPSTSYWAAIFHGMARAWSFERGQRVAAGTRFLILYGEEDPMTRDGGYCEAMIERLGALGPAEASAMGVRGARSGLFLEEARLGIAGRILAWHGGAQAAEPLPRPAGVNDIDVISEHFRRIGETLTPMSPQDFVTLCYGGIEDESRWVDLMMRIMLTLSRSGGDEFEQFLAEMMPHWDRAFGLHQKLLTDAALGDVWADMLERIGMGCALIDGRGAILHANSRFEPALRESMGAGSGAGARGAVERLTGELLRASGLSPARLSAQGDLLRWEDVPVGLIVQPPALARHARRLGNPVGMLVLRQTGDGAGLAGLVELGWGLTPQEARVALEVMQGRTPAQIAEGLGVSINTVRSHLAQAYAKTETAGKAELAAALHRSPLSWLASAGGAGSRAAGADHPNE